MESPQLVTGIVAAAAGSLSACLMVWFRWDHAHPWSTLVGLFLSSVVAFCGTVAAAKASLWSYGVGGALVALLLSLLPCRWAWDRHQQKKRARARGLWLSEGTVEDLPISDMKRAFATRPIARQGLSLAEFKIECLSAVTCLDVGSFRQMAGMLLLAKQAEIETCRRWYVKCAIVLDLFVKSKDEELVNVVRLMWKTHLFCRALRCELTRNAIYRLKTEMAKFLIHFLIQEHPKDDWVKAYLTESGNAQTPPSGSFTRIEDLSIECWYAAGDLEECRLCRYRPWKRPAVLEVPYRGLRYIFRFTRRCKTCGCRTLRRGLCRRPDPKTPWDWRSWDSVSVTGSEDIGLGRIFD
ncbi:hypothetical protein PSACC_00329 [Paramicrosporidium saccamoebae]|uniref:Uncharacterized protein n=1 Tax=Paramicrosporidium saccamoebae TaxID=1246581 RepID=A0A2H9TQ36_9FUNG|nr:hypothetical protein PSACC_00329 [Paramicrosporidium saccamoebae]